MKSSKKKPFKISRFPPRKLRSLTPEKSPEHSQKRALIHTDPTIERQNQILATQTVFKNCYNLFNVNPGLLPELLQRYADDNVKYRDEEFTQQADNFLTRIAASKKIPKELRAKYPLYFILVSICKVKDSYQLVFDG